MRILNFSDGFESATEPTQGLIAPTNLKVFASDSDFVTDKGSAATLGDLYSRSSDNNIRYFDGTNWTSVTREDSSGNVVIPGNLTVNGTSTTLNTQTLDVEDVNITVNKGGNDASADGAGLTVDRTGTDGSLVYDSTKASKWKLGNVGAESEVVTVSDTQTLTNKTLTSPAITSPTGIVKADVGLSNVDNTSDATKNAAVATLTNKTLTAPVINSPTGIVKGDVGLSNVDNTSDATKNAAVATLTNKTLTSPILTTPSVDIETYTDQSSTPSAPSAGKRKVYSKTNGKVYHLDSAGVERELGSGGTGVNFVVGGDAEGGSIFATYKDSASAVPVDGTGGVPTISSASTTSTNPLSGANSFLLTHPASNVQGEGWSYDFTIDNANKAKVLKVEFDYIVNSGTFVAGSSGVDSDIEVYIYDVTNAQIIQPSSYKLLSNNTSVADHFSATFQTASNSTSYRLIFHCATTSASSFVLKVDSVSVSPSHYVYGTPITDWQSYTPTITGAGTPTNVAFWWRRVGDSVQVKGTFTTGTVSAASATFTLPSGMTVDTVKIAASSSTGDFIGYAFRKIATGSTRKRFALQCNSGTGNLIYYASDDYTTAVSPAASVLGNAIWGNTENQSIYTVAIPIQGWSSAIQMSDQTDSRIVSFSGGKSGGSQAVTGSTTNITFAAEKDTHSGWTGSTYVVQVPGDYLVSATVYSVASVANIILYKNGSNFTGLLNSPANTYTSGSTLIPGLVVGDVLSLRSAASITIAGDSTIKFGISRISGPSAIAANESINLRYTSTAGQSLASGNTTLSFATKDYDSHGAFSSNTTFTAPIQGKYVVKAKVASNTISGLSANYLRILVNGSSVSEEQYAMTYATASNFSFRISDTLKLNAGDTVTIQFQNGFGSSVTAVTTVGAVSVAIERVGN